MPESVIAGDQMGVQSSGVSLVSTVDCACGRARLEAMFKQTVASIFTGPIAHLHIKVDASAVEIETAATARRVLSACGHQRATESPSLLRPHPPHPSHPTQKGGGGTLSWAKYKDHERKSKATGLGMYEADLLDY